jgi:O-antigen/teichoic acid export membrane protein
MIKALIDRARALIAGDSLKARVMQSSMAILASEVYSNVVRLGSNLIITRLLYPEAFGLMLIVNLVILVLGQLSDVGVKPALIARTDEINERYLNTAWTMLMVRGVLLALLLVALAFPVAAFYDEPQLAGLLLLTSAMPVIQSMASPQAMLAEKRVQLSRYILSGVVSNTLTVTILLTWLFIEPSVWALAANGVIGAVISSALTYYFFPGPRPRLCWDKSAVVELFSFGRWVFIATALTFLARQGDSLIVSKATTTEQLGTFSIAIALFRMLDQVVGRLNWSVMFPAYAELNRRQESAASSERRQFRVKLALFGLTTPVILAFTLFGSDVIDFLYDDRYHDAGWILQILGVGGIFVALGSPIRTLSMSLGDSYRYMWQQLFSVITLIIAMVGGWALGGFVGLIVGIAIAQSLEYCVARWAVAKYKVGDYLSDFAFAGAMLGLIFIVWSIRGWPGPE